MSREILAGLSGLQGAMLSLPAQLAVERFLEALMQVDPARAAQALVGPGNEGTVYVYVPLPADDEQNIALHEAVAEIGATIVADTGIVIVLMPADPVSAVLPSA
jgi:hypothetical protein